MVQYPQKETGIIITPLREEDNCMKDFLFGADYYPEHWPRSRWETDAVMMRDMGLDVVRLAEFSWFKLEPEEGKFDFAWLDEALEVLGRAGIKAILGTPTAAPPAWIIASDPSIEPVDSQGRVHHFGGRHHDCQSNQTYRKHIARFVTAFADHFGKNEHVIGWQIDNELGNSHDDFCHCPSCQARFREWLKGKYGTAEALNRAWGTEFWSQGYQDFSQVTSPMITATGGNPSRDLDWRRFCADLVLEFHEYQAKIIRPRSPGRFITHNLMGFCDKFRYDELAKMLEFVSQDQYPGGHFRPNPSADRSTEMAAELDFVRGLKDQPFSVMEQQSSITGWEILGRAPKPGQLALWSLQTVAHGADAVIWFRWRSCAMGMEQYWHGLLPHSGIPGRNFEELSAFVRQLKPLLRDMQGAMPEKQAAILFSYDQEWAARIQPHHPDLSYTGHLMSYYRALHARNIPVDFTFPDRDWSAYKLLIAPLWFLADPGENEKFRNYVKAGGTLVLTCRSGIKHPSNLCITDLPLPAGLTDLAGIEVDEYDCLRDCENTVLWEGHAYPCLKWCDIMHTVSAEVRGTWGGEFYAGTPAITRNAYGSGAVWYVGTEMGDDLALAVIQALEKECGLSSAGTADKGVEITVRRKEKSSWLFVLNHTDESRSVDIPKGWHLLQGTEGPVLPPFGFRIYSKEK